MSALLETYIPMLEGKLKKDYFPVLPVLVDLNKSQDDIYAKNLSRGLAAFAIRNICDTTVKIAAESIVDDFDDKGIDGIYYDGQSQTLYLVQAKFKANKEFNQEDALKFSNGVRKVLGQDFDDFNQLVKARTLEIEGALQTCNNISLVVTYVGGKVSDNAREIINDLIESLSVDEQRLSNVLIEYNAPKIISDLRQDKAYKTINTELFINNSTHVHQPRTTYFGLIALTDLIRLHTIHGVSLYEKNIRTFLGHKTDVNDAIQKTLLNKANEFLYLNNGVAALCHHLETKETNRNTKKLRLRVLGLSIINGAQTIASAAHFTNFNPGVDISDARVSITIIKADANDVFGKEVTRARNHQNVVATYNFAALDDEQERLRREMALLGYTYVYKDGIYNGLTDPNIIEIDEAAQALSLFNKDPRYAVWLKKEPGRLLQVESSQYKELFTSTLTAQELINSVKFYRYIQTRMKSLSDVAAGQERLTYRHGVYVFGWMLAQSIQSEQKSSKLFNVERLNLALSLPVDNLRNLLWLETQKLLIYKGPLALYKNQTDVLPIMEKIMINSYGLIADPVLLIKRAQQNVGQLYPVNLFNYLVSKAPQIANLT